jgi:hypothetical protein
MTMRSGHLRLVSENHPAIARDLLGPLTEVLRLGRRYCGGDLEKVLILLTVAIRTAEHPQFAKYTEAQLVGGEPAVLPSLGTNVRSIASSLEMPRETVRRKVNELIDMGWLVRVGQSLHFTAEAYGKLTPVREAMNALAVRNFELVSRLLEAKARGAGG